MILLKIANRNRTKVNVFVMIPFMTKMEHVIIVINRFQDVFCVRIIKPALNAKIRIILILKLKVINVYVLTDGF